MELLLDIFSLKKEIKNAGRRKGGKKEGTKMDLEASGRLVWKFLAQFWRSSGVRLAECAGPEKALLSYGGTPAFCMLLV